MVLLHGILHISINEAKDLPNKDKLLSRFKLLSKVKRDVSDPFVVVKLGFAEIAKTRVIKNNLNPKWEERFTVEVGHDADEILFAVFDKDKVGKEHLGSYKLSVDKLVQWNNIGGWFELEDESGKPSNASLNVELRFRPARDLDLGPEVPHCYFPMRSSCRVTLYQDAHTPHVPLHDEIFLKDGSTYKPECAWRDIYDAITNAKHFICLTGWSVHAATCLLREDGDDKVSLGELISKKAKEGLKVLALVWNERLSTDITPSGLMGTHDQDTAKFFKGTGVHVELVPRQKDQVLHLDDPTATGKAFLSNQFVSTCYSHHQKTIILDTEVPNSKKRAIVAFVGGLDLTDGRWDTPDHHLFSTLRSHHQGDFYNKVVSVSEKLGPRQPWHDIHCKLEGEIALDVFTNFAERWQKQVPKHKGMLPDVNKGIFEIENDMLPDRSVTWNVQLFRSINCDSAIFDKAAFATLREKKGKAFDDSIHRAYVHHIRRAQDFLYIENQYFLGSSHAWKNPESVADHLIPLEITNRINQKIKEGERFAVYVIIPMFPEGDPGSMPVQEILCWQTRTIEMMYKKVAGGIAAKGIDAHPTDYLNFYCLGKKDMDIPSDLPDPKPKTTEEKLRRKRRHMIYVHSKMMITDDEYIIVGSANINQRSMAGTRDTEIAMGAYQPDHTILPQSGPPRGQVHGFRVALWGEHMGTVEEVYQQPASLECVHKVNDLAKNNWQLYRSWKEDNPMTGFLIKYPIDIQADGCVKSLPDKNTFPDSKAPILGAKMPVLPPKVTT